MPLLKRGKYAQGSTLIHPSWIRKFPEIQVGDVVYCLDEQVWASNEDHTLLIIRRDHDFSTTPTDAYRNRVTRVDHQTYTIYLADAFVRDDAPKLSPDARDWPSSCVLHQMV